MTLVVADRDFEMDNIRVTYLESFEVFPSGWRSGFIAQSVNPDAEFNSTTIVKPLFILPPELIIRYFENSVKSKHPLLILEGAETRQVHVRTIRDNAFRLDGSP